MIEPQTLITAAAPGGCSSARSPSGFNQSHRAGKTPLSQPRKQSAAGQSSTNNSQINRRHARHDVECNELMRAGNDLIAVLCSDKYLVELHSEQLKLV